MDDPFKQASLSAKIFILSALAIMLSFGLCGTTVAGAVSSTVAGYFVFSGIVLLFLGILGIIVGTVIAIFQSWGR